MGPFSKTRAFLTFLFVIKAAVEAQDFRLPTDLLPDHYDVQLLVRLDPAENFSFEGSVGIRFFCERETDTFVLHNFELVVDEAGVILVEEESGRQITIANHEYEWSYADFQKITLEESLEPGKAYNLYIPYAGAMRPITDRYGLTYGQYNGDEGLEYFASTQMEPLAARWVFPCFDEPGLKATFNLTIGHPTKYSAFSNMELFASAPVEEEPGYIWDFFLTTPRMTTYLVAIIIGDFTRVPTDDPRQFVLVRDEVASNVVESAGFAPPILTGLEEKLQTPFPLGKLDHAGVLGFGGGMENWGLIIYGEAGVADEGGAASLTLMTHETAHMWTGDLVTCKWWNVTWLNEGMTHFLTHYSADLIDESFDYMAFLGTVLMDSAMTADMDSNALPMVIPIERPDDIGNAFSGPLIYNRGGNIGRFMYYLLGEETFLRGMRDYFAANSYQAVTETDLFSALDKAAEQSGIELPESFEALMTPWTNQAGFPVVTVTRGAASGDSTAFILSQRRHLNVPLNDHNDDRLWTIPLTWATKSSPDSDDMSVKAFLSTQEETIEVSGVGQNDWILFNNQRMGYYRVNYDTESWLLIFEALETDPEAIPAATSAGLISDLTEFCLYEMVEPLVCGQMDKFLRSHKNDLTVWFMAEKAAKKLSKELEDNKQLSVASLLQTVEKFEHKVANNPIGVLKEVWERRQQARTESLEEFFIKKRK